MPTISADTFHIVDLVKAKGVDDPSVYGLPQILSKKLGHALASTFRCD